MTELEFFCVAIRFFSANAACSAPAVLRFAGVGIFQRRNLEARRAGGVIAPRARRSAFLTRFNFKVFGVFFLLDYAVSDRRTRGSCALSNLAFTRASSALAFVDVAAGSAR